jgi:hypothetical protein
MFKLKKRKKCLESAEERLFREYDEVIGGLINGLIESHMATSEIAYNNRADIEKLASAIEELQKYVYGNKRES